MTITAMFVRNLAVLAVFSLAAGLIAAGPIAAMAIFTAGFALRRAEYSGPTLHVQTGDRRIFRRYVILSSVTTVIGLSALLALSVWRR